MRLLSVMTGLIFATWGTGCKTSSCSPGLAEASVEASKIEKVETVQMGMNREEAEALLDEKAQIDPADWVGAGFTSSRYRKSFDGYIRYDADGRVMSITHSNALKHPTRFVPDEPGN